MDVPTQATAAVADAAGRAAGADGQARQASIVGAAEAAVSGTRSTTGAQAALPGVLADVPVAVLVIDRATGTVTYANSAAIELAGSVRLPVAMEEWSGAAGLTDLTGAPLSRSGNLLRELAAGRPVTGEAVRLVPARSTDEERAREDDLERLLWVTGFPLSQEHSEQQLSLVVFLQLEEGHALGDPETQLQALRERAVVATDIAFTISDPRQPDDPLVWVNPSFTRITGYSYEESVGRNCRFLQGPSTDRARLQELREALTAQQPITTTLLNHRKDGTAFWNQLAITPVFDGDDELISFVGVQTDVTERVRVEADRAAAFTAEQEARKDAEEARAAAEEARRAAERAQGRLALMAEATSTLSATLDMGDLLDRLAGLCVPLLADWVFLTLTDDSGAITGTAGRHRRGLAEPLRRFAAARVADLPEAAPIRRTLESAEPLLVEDITPDLLARALPSSEGRAAVAELGASAVLTVPLVARRRTLGVLSLVTESKQRGFNAEDVELARDLCRRAALAMDNVRLYQQEHTVAETLQRSLLPDLPEITGVSAAAQYVSASSAADVGGDFYELLALPDDTVGIAIGDVVGHDVAAAAAMGHLRGLLRACIWDADDGDPGVVLGRVDRLVQGLHVAPMATLVYARAVRPERDGGPWRLQVGNAGHPPLMVRYPDGQVDVLDDVTGLLIGVDGGARRQARWFELPAGSTVVAYTDGLIERPGADLDQGLEQLATRLAAAPADATPAELCVAAVGPEPDRRDDIAVIAVQLT
ncbi:SpoIIE family protein phosphatase [Modestobacter sp. NPDC049651]|uniref:SpoIIE family protein phosphatase n=1 Tax=unclassified Modestobacter TaxID=2643866 RepID=UPI0033F41E6D